MTALSWVTAHISVTETSHGLIRLDKTALWVQQQRLFAEWINKTLNHNISAAAAKAWRHRIGTLFVMKPSPLTFCQAATSLKTPASSAMPRFVVFRQMFEQNYSPSLLCLSISLYFLRSCELYLSVRSHLLGCNRRLASEASCCICLQLQIMLLSTKGQLWLYAVSAEDWAN